MRDQADASHAVCGEAVAILSAILMPPINLAIWQRKVDPRLATWVEALDLSVVDDIRFTCDIADLAPVLADAAAEAGYPEDSVRLRGDIVTLARNFAGLMDDPRVEIRLEIVETDACHKFHADYVAVRLITTYRGPGTQWLSATDAEALKGGSPLSDIEIRQIETGEVALFKGRVWSPDNAIIHRSPPVAGTGAQRLVLVINPGREAATIEDVAVDDRRVAASGDTLTMI